MKKLIGIGIAALVGLVFATNLILANDGRLLEIRSPQATTTPTPQPVVRQQSPKELTFAEKLARPQDPNNLQFPVALAPIGIKRLECIRERGSHFIVRMAIFPLQRVAPSIISTMSLVKVDNELAPGVLPIGLKNFGTINSERILNKTFQSEFGPSFAPYINVLGPINCKIDFTSEKQDIGSLVVEVEEL